MRAKKNYIGIFLSLLLLLLKLSVFIHTDGTNTLLIRPPKLIILISHVLCYIKYNMYTVQMR